MVPIAYRHVSLSRPIQPIISCTSYQVPIAYRHVSLSRLRMLKPLNASTWVPIAYRHVSLSRPFMQRARQTIVIKFPLPIGMYPFRDSSTSENEKRCPWVPIAYRHVSLSRPGQFDAIFQDNNSSHCLSACIPFETANPCVTDVNRAFQFPLPIGMYPFRDRKKRNSVPWHWVPIAYRHVSLSRPK